MPIKILHKFQKEYGKVRGKRIFYAWMNKHKSPKRLFGVRMK